MKGSALALLLGFQGKGESSFQDKAEVGEHPRRGQRWGSDVQGIFYREHPAP